MKVKIFSIEQFLEYINEGRNIKAMVIFPNLSVACDAVKAGFRTKEIQMPYPASRMMIKSLSDYFSEEDIEKKKLSAPKGTKLYKNKILGLRGRATGIIFSNFERKNHVVSKEYAKKFIRDRSNRQQTEWFEIFSAGLDTAYSSNSPDTISMSFIGITNKGNCFVLDERVQNNANLDIPIAPSDTVKNFIDFLERNRKEWGFAKDVFIDSADQATITEFAKYKRLNGTVYNFNNAWKKTMIIDRIILQLGWFAHNQYKILNHCVNYISELETYSWMEGKDNTPEDANDHMVNSTQYSWLPYKNRIGISNNL